MRAASRGALLFSLLPKAPASISASAMRRRLLTLGIEIHVRSVQRDLALMPESIVVRSGRTSWSAR